MLAILRSSKSFVTSTSWLTGTVMFWKSFESALLMVVIPYIPIIPITDPINATPTKPKSNFVLSFSFMVFSLFSC
jgi:hypothetical protein